MYVLTNFGNAKLQSLTLQRISPPKTITVTTPWVSNVDPVNGTKKVPEQPKTARVHANPIVLDGQGSGSQWEIKARVSSGPPALLVITLMHDQSRVVAASFEANAAGGARVTAVRFTE